jgi:hypothetical protein
MDKAAEPLVTRMVKAARHYLMHLDGEDFRNHD